MKRIIKLRQLHESYMEQRHKKEEKKLRFCASTKCWVHMDPLDHLSVKTGKCDTAATKRVQTIPG